MPGILYIVATPIGNLSDITLRALEILKSVDYILAEDTRVTGKLLDHYAIKNTLKSYHQHTSDNKKLNILNDLLRAKNIALVCDAGTPGISDPGNELINFLYSKQNLLDQPFAETLAAPSEPSKSFKKGDVINVIPIPGPSSLTAAISVSGFDMSRYLFIGFFPKKKKTKLLKFLAASNLAFVYFDSPHRVIKNLGFIAQQFGDKEVLVARELTKLHETLYRGNISEIHSKLQAVQLKGEVVVIVSNKPVP
jgi:16S rRNA (cytidine1402-2'-O)-methyltransferase